MPYHMRALNKCSGEGIARVRAMAPFLKGQAVCLGRKQSSCRNGDTVNDSEMSATERTDGTAECCPRCGEVDPRFAWQTFVNGTHHLRAECPGCGRFLRHVPQTPERVATANQCLPSPGQATCATPERKRATLTCASCGTTREAGVIFCPACLDPYVRLRSRETIR